jgi:NAD(P)-dependent dehydrogenase (short-subunit alcohol dehydrogenase family)
VLLLLFVCVWRPQANYAAGKAAIVGLTKTVAKEWGHLNVRCNAIAYGWIETRLTRAKEAGEAIVVDGEKVGCLVPVGLTYMQGSILARQESSDCGVK